jgi:uncharacterized protein
MCPVAEINEGEDEERCLWIKAFQAAGDCFLYSAYRNTIHRVDPALFAMFREEGAPAGREERHRLAVGLGLIPDPAFQITVFPDAMIREGMATLRREGPFRIVLTVTEDCNYRCRYCTFSGLYPDARRHGRRRMPAETAFQALRWYFRFPRAAYRISFYGGEPLLARGLIHRVIERARQEVPGGARLSFAMTTNGSLLDDATISFFADHRVDLTISLDGPAPVHDRYRRTPRGRPTFARVWNRVHRVRELCPEYFRKKVYFCMTWPPPYPAAEVADFIRQNSHIFAEKIPVILKLDHEPPAVYEALGIPNAALGDELDSLRERYLAQLTAGCQPESLGRALNTAAMAKLARRSMSASSALTIGAGQCIPGRRCHVTPDGLLHACERASNHFAIGHVDTGFDDPKIEAILKRYAEIVQGHCQGCWAARLCAKCMVDLADGADLSAERLSKLCAQRKKELEQNLILYCRARSLNDRCFKDLTMLPGDADDPED